MLALLPAYNRLDGRMAAFNEFPMIRVVHPAYHAFPKDGQPSFCPSGRRRLSCDRVLATRIQDIRWMTIGRLESGKTNILLDK